MVGWSVILFVIAVGVVVSQAVYVVLFAKSMLADDSFHRATLSTATGNQNSPPAAIILCVRGCDPTLKECLKSVASQDYPDFQVHIVVDHKQDPAVELVQQFASKHKNVVIHFLTNPTNTCGLKCSSLIQAIDSLPAKTEVVAMLDADSTPRRNWLQQIAFELQDDEVGVVSGIRCFVPSDHRIGSLVRYQWNSAATVQMYLYQIPWGGTLGFQRSTLEEANLSEIWNQTFCEDTILADVMRDHRKRVVISPALCMPNNESCELSKFLPWVTRQLLTAKLYHSKWPLVVAHAMLTSFSIFALFATLMIAMVTSNSVAIAWLTAGIVVYFAANWLMLVSNERSVSHQLNMAGQPACCMNLTDHWIQLCLTPVTQCAYLIAVFKTTFLKRVSWRQVNYDIDGPFEIRRLNHEPYIASSSFQDSL